MRRTPVESTTLRAIGYDSIRRELELEFRDNGDIYRYLDVPPQEHQEFMAAPSKGTYLNRVFKLKKHRYFVVKSGRKPAA